MISRWVPELPPHTHTNRILPVLKNKYRNWFSMCLLRQANRGEDHLWSSRSATHRVPLCVRGAQTARRGSIQWVPPTQPPAESLSLWRFEWKSRQNLPNNSKRWRNLWWFQRSTDQGGTERDVFSAAVCPHTAAAVSRPAAEFCFVVV